MLLMVRAVRRPNSRLMRARRRILQDGVPRYVRTMVRWLQIRQTERRDTESIVRLRVGSELPGASLDSSPSPLRLKAAAATGIVPNRFRGEDSSPGHIFRHDVSRRISEYPDKRV